MSITKQIPLTLPHRAAMGADDFLVTACNRDAAAWIEKWPDWPSFGLLVTGQSGSGKTHLLYLWRDKSGAKLLTIDDLKTHSPQALTADIKYLALDNADAIAGDAPAEEALFHLYNHLKSSQGSLLLTMVQGAGQAGFQLPDLRSRLLALPAVALQAPDDDLLEALIVKQFRDRQITLDAGVVSYLAPRISRDAASIRTLVERLDQASLAASRKITISLVRQILEDGDAHV